MSEDSLPDTFALKGSALDAFELGTRAPIVPGGPTVEDVIDFFEEETAARRAMHALEREEIVPRLEAALKNRQEELRRRTAHVLARELVGLYADRVAGAESEEDAAAFEGARLASPGEGLDTEVLREAGADDWATDPPGPLVDVAEDLLGRENWTEWAEWSATPALRWAAWNFSQAFEEDAGELDSDEWIGRFREAVRERDLLDPGLILSGKIASAAAESLNESAEGDGLSPLQIEGLLGLRGGEEDAPAPRTETPDYDPDPFTGPMETAGLLADPFSNAVRGALMDAEGEPAETKVGEWDSGPGGAPVRVEKLKNPYEGRAVLKVQAHADAEPAEVEAAMGWEMLERMDMDTVWLHSVLLAHACAPHRRGDRETMLIPRKRVENALGIRQNRNMTVRERAERVKKHVEALQSLYVQFQGVRRHGEKLHFEGDMTASPLWFVQMKARGQKDLFTGEVTADWHLKAKEGVWGSEFLHNHGDQWAPLPKEWFDQIDRRGKDWTQRLAVALLFLFRINSKNGGEVKLSAGKMLDICGTDMSGSSRRGTERKRRLSKSLDALARDYNIDVRAEAVHIDNTSGIKHPEWKNRVATFYPPDEMAGELFRNEDDGRPPLPEVKGGDWTAAQIKRLRSDLGDSQSEFADRLGVSRQMVSRYENNHDPPSNEVRKVLDSLDSRFR